MSERQAHWDQVWSTKAADAVSWFQAEAEPSLGVIASLGLPPDAPILDVGGGASRLVDALIERGFADVTVLDISDAALAVARERLGARAGPVHWEAVDITGWTPPRRYLVWHDRAVFHFLTEPEQRAGYRRALEHGLAPGGHAIVATFAADGPERCSGLPVQRYDAAALAAEIGPGFRLVRDWRQVHHTPGGAAQAFQWCVFERIGRG
jgi:SAM-dependent methyltransferase